MFFEIDRSRYGAVLALLDGRHPHEMPLQGVLAGPHRGHVHVDNPTNPSVAVVSATGIGAYFLGDAHHSRLRQHLDDFVEHTLKPRDQAEIGAECFIGIALDEAWYPTLEAAFAPREPEWGHYRLFRFEPGRLPLQPRLPILPDGCRPLRIDRAMLCHPDNAALRRDLLEFWPDCATFLAHGIGYAICHGAHAVSACFSCYAVGRHHELAVRTYLPQLRRRGLATHVALSCVLQARNTRCIPHWSTEDDNHASLRLAERCGFVFERRVRYCEFDY
ncbi:GNAT family N-acetyltransferase [Chitiniphilus shinanonensis]|uniref:GNAT family N-acetyltransferase n=1 Tax=Chitiniphilus shinanonensis TaxID=553088 RepID=UPI0033420B0B